MEIKLRNIGKIENAVVEIDGITVIAGENNTGKSTVSKALYAMFNSFYQVQNQIKANRSLSISNSLYKALYHINIENIQFQQIDELIELFLKGNHAYKSKNDILEALILLLNNNGIVMSKNLYQELEEASEKILEILTVSDKEIVESLMTNRLQGEFKGQICNVFTEKTGTIEVNIRNQNVVATVHNNNVEEVSGIDGFSLLTEAVYIDDPFVLDNFNGRITNFKFHRYDDHRDDIQRKLHSNRNGNVIDEIIAKKNFDEIYQLISSVCDGEMMINQRGEAVYHRSDNDKYLDVRNLSSGLKTFVILKTLFENGVIENKGTIILDEPEIHLHPEWQLLFAELIVLLQKQFNIHILLNTHSPYFLRAVQVYAGKYAISDRCRYYLSEVNGDSAQINDVSNNIDKIYKKLYRPLQDLENVEWDDD